MPIKCLVFGSSTQVQLVAQLPQRGNRAWCSSRFGENKKSGIAAALRISIISRLYFHAPDIFEDEFAFRIELHHDHRILRDLSAQNTFR